MFSIVLVIAVLMTFVSISQIKENTYIDFNIKKYFKNYIGIFILYFIVLFILITYHKFFGALLFFCFMVLFTVYYPRLLEKQEKEKIEKKLKEEVEAIKHRNRIIKEKEEKRKLDKEQQEVEKKNKLEKERLELEIKEKLQREAVEKEEAEAHKKELNQYMDFISELQSTVNIFDTNIFMDKTYELIFKLFLYNNIKILMGEKQFEEIVNLKNSSNIDKSSKARFALNIIDLLSKKDIINIGFKSLSLDIDNKAYADPEIFKFCLKISETHRVNFITNDRILSIKTIQLAKKNNANNGLKVFNGDEFTQLFKAYIPTEYRSIYL